ncbi:unnamed protein product [Mucor hiemalis]
MKYRSSNGKLQDSQYAPTPQKKKQTHVQLKEDRARKEAKLQSTFCPPLDPSLIQAIWNDSYDYTASFEILTSLAKDADHTLDQQEVQQTMEKLDLEEESITASSTSESDDENFTFLSLCFPSIPFQDLVEALEANDNDVEKATDVLLNKEFIQGVENDGGQLLQKGDGNYVDGKQQRKKGSNKSKAKKKKGTVWTSGQLPAVSTTQGNTTIPMAVKKPVIEDDDPYEELATVPFNCWHQYDSSVQLLQRYFSRVPQFTLAASVQHCRGNVIASVKAVMEKYPDLKPEHEFTWSVVRDLSSLREELQAIMVDRTPNDVYRVAVGVVIQHEGQEKTLEQLTQIGIEHFLSFDVNQLDLEERLKKMAKESEFIRVKRKKNEIPVIPEYLLMNNQKDYIEDDPEECRDIAMQLILERNELFRKAAAAYRQAKNKGPEGGIAFFYSDTARQIDSRAKDWNMRAARATVRRHRIRHNDEYLLDLHGLTVAEAQVLIKEGVTQWWSRSQMQSTHRQFKPLKIITGVGKHSQYGESKLLPATTKLLKREGWLFEMFNPGCIYVKGVTNK